MVKEVLMAFIQDEMDEVREYWRAEDGGLTMAAADTLFFLRGLLEMVEKGDFEGVLSMEPEEASTAPEVKCLHEAFEWAWGEWIEKKINEVETIE